MSLTIRIENSFKCVCLYIYIHIYVYVYVYLYVYADCLPLWQRATNNSDKAMASDSGSFLMRTAEAFASRDKGEGAFDSTGAWHPGVAMHRTCKLEPKDDSLYILNLNIFV